MFATVQANTDQDAVPTNEFTKEGAATIIFVIIIVGLGIYVYKKRLWEKWFK